MRRTLSQSFIASDVNCTKCIGMSLFLWFICVVIFVSRNGDEISRSNINIAHPFTINNIPKNQQSSSSPSSSSPSSSSSSSSSSLSLSYTESLSSELSSNGWKPIYIHSWNVRMPAEEMDYLLETYWYPHIKEHQTVDNIDIKTLKKKKKKPKDTKGRILIDNKKEEKEEEEHHEKLRNAPSTSHKNRELILNYPSDWKHSCFPHKLNDKECIFKHMKYWNAGIKLISSKPLIFDKYVTFLKDCGGFNNIRQGFEFHAMIAWITKRTLVIPPDMPWYLIDFGQITRGKNKISDNYKGSWPDNKNRRFGVSNYDIWFDLDDLSMAIPIITTPEFIRREFDSLQIPIEYVGGDIVNLDKHKARSYEKWLNNKATELNVNLPWGQLSNLLYWPSIKSVESKNSLIINNAWIDNRNKREYTSFLKAAKFIHFPSCSKGIPGEDHDYRYLGNIARSIAFDNIETDKKYKQILRDHIHLNIDIIEYASMVISILGAFNYSSFHIRRNELQYKYVFATAHQSYNNVKPLIGDTEILYIATDEIDNNFFKVFQEGGKRKVYRWSDFFGINAIFEETKNIKIPGKLHGEIEMVICGMGRIFFGTKESTFSEYIGRLRGYLNAPYKQVLYHHYQLTNDVDQSSKISRNSFASKPYNGQIYKMPFPDLWQDIQNYP